jgi:hypothetical protein
MFSAIKWGIIAVIKWLQDYMHNALPLVLEFLAELMPVEGQVAMAPFILGVKAANEWVAFSEMFVAWELWMAFRISWAGVKILIRVFTVTMAGRG